MTIFNLAIFGKNCQLLLLEAALSIAQSPIALSVLSINRKL
ncbi:hypothetical protein [Microcoleus sp. LEGE 07076]|nr:hypothetical protein [Microcoleus sp. LEGE 07076]